MNLFEFSFLKKIFRLLFHRRLKDKYETDLQNLEQTERLTREKYNETRTKLAECEANKQNMQSTVKQLELQLTHSQKVNFYFISFLAVACLPNKSKLFTFELSALIFVRLDDEIEISKKCYLKHTLSFIYLYVCRCATSFCMKRKI